MAQYRDDPMTDEEFEELREKMDETREEVREYLDAQGVDTSSWDDSSTEVRADSGECGSDSAADIFLLSQQREA